MDRKHYEPESFGQALNRILPRRPCESSQECNRTPCSFTGSCEFPTEGEADWPPDNGFKLTTNDPIEKPAHYTAGKVECIEAIEAAAEGWPGWIAPHLANAMKYEWRAFKKGKALRDLRKARWYLDRAMEALLLHGYTETE